MAGVIVVAAVAFIALVVAAERHATRRRREQLALLARELGGPPPGNGPVVTGSWEGQSIAYELTARGSGKSRRPWTEVQTAIPAGVRFSLELRAETATARGMRDRGLAVDVVVGDPEFDAAFIVEGAPADVVRALLTPELRQTLLALRPLEAKTSEGAIVVAKPGHILDQVPARQLVGATAALGRVRAATSAADAALEARVGLVGDPYRAEPDAVAARAARAARDEELATLARVRDQRKRYERLIVGIVFGVVFLVILILAANGSGHR